MKALSNPAVTGMLDRLTGVLGSLSGRLVGHRVDLSERRRSQGEVRRLIEAVLAEHPDGLPAREVRVRVEERLGRMLPRSTVKGALAAGGAFERVARGRYRLRDARVSVGAD